jgi:hypothetical protein
MPQKLVPDSIMNYETTAGAPGTKVAGEAPTSQDYGVDEISSNIRAAKARDDAAEAARKAEISARARRDAPSGKFTDSKGGVNSGEAGKKWYEIFK